MDPSWIDVGLSHEIEAAKYLNYPNDISDTINYSPDENNGIFNKFKNVSIIERGENDYNFQKKYDRSRTSKHKKLKLSTRDGKTIHDETLSGKISNPFNILNMENNNTSVE